MRNIRLEIEYDGTNYYGWQVQNSPCLAGPRLRREASRQAQSTVPALLARFASVRLGEPKARREARRAGRHGPQKRTIQQTIENALQKILQEKVKLICSGRTDTGVHAQAQVANFKTASPIGLDKLHFGLNALLPEDIAVTRVTHAPVDFHSRFCAKSKVYQYVILNSKHRSVFFRNSAYFCRYPLNINLMRKEAKALLGRHNFSAFCASAGKLKNQVKTIKKITISKRNNLITITVKADGFLYNMVRNIAGTLIDIGRGKLSENSLKKILFSKNRRLAGPTAPAKGLYLLKIGY